MQIKRFGKRLPASK